MGNFSYAPLPSMNITNLLSFTANSDTIFKPMADRYRLISSDSQLGQKMLDHLADDWVVKQDTSVFADMDNAIAYVFSPKSSPKDIYYDADYDNNQLFRAVFTDLEELSHAYTRELGANDTNDFIKIFSSNSVQANDNRLEPLSYRAFRLLIEGIGKSYALVIARELFNDEEWDGLIEESQQNLPMLHAIDELHQRGDSKSHQWMAGVKGFMQSEDATSYEMAYLSYQPDFEKMDPDTLYTVSVTDLADYTDYLGNKLFQNFRVPKQKIEQSVECYFDPISLQTDNDRSTENLGRIADSIRRFENFVEISHHSKIHTHIPFEFHISRSPSQTSSATSVDIY
jgi:hypothetical protein